MRFLWLHVGLIVVLGLSVALFGRANAQDTVPVAEVSVAPYQLDTSCLPHNVFLTDRIIHSADPAIRTVEESLNYIQPTCDNDGYKNSTGMRVQFYRLGGCHGMTSNAITNFVTTQSPYVAKLKTDSRYWVVELACNTNALP